MRRPRESPTFESEDAAVAAFKQAFDKLVAEGGGRAMNYKLHRYLDDPSQGSTEAKIVQMVVNLINSTENFSQIQGALCAYSDSHSLGIPAVTKQPLLREAIKRKIQAVDITEGLRNVTADNPLIYVLSLFWDDNFHEQLIHEGYPVDSHTRSKAITTDEARAFKERILKAI